MPSSCICPYCNTTYMHDSRLERCTHINFEPVVPNSDLSIYQQVCPNCNKIHVLLIASGSCWENKFYFSYPPANAMYLPDYIPAPLRQDYLEAVQIADLSPKASATLARRCLQGMIHDFWEIHEKNLNAEISALRGRIPSKQWEAIDAIRKIGNIGAHMENNTELIVDVDPDEAKKLLKVIELLFKAWYISRHEDDILLDEVKKMAAEKEDERLAIKDPDSQ